jgi:DNA-binding CsgD family transcriptional regulator
VHVTLISGPAGFEPGSAIAELLAARWGNMAGRKVVRLSFSAEQSRIHVRDALPVSRDQSGTVLVLKDVHRLPPDELVALDEALRRAGTTCVATVALPVAPASRAAFAEVFGRLRRDGLVESVRLRPLSQAQLADLVTATLEARPEPRLVAWLWRLSKGWPGAARAALASAWSEGLVRVLGRYAYLTGDGAPRLPAGHDLALEVRAMGDAVWKAAKATAVLGPVGAALPLLAGAALGISQDEILRLLERLRETAVLVHHRPSSSWRYRLPLVGAAVTASIGPYERRVLAEVAVRALRDGSAQCADPSYLPGLLMNAGTLGDPDRAKAELLAAAGLPEYEGRRAIRWLRAAAMLAGDRKERSGILMRHALACVSAGDATAAMESSELVLRAYTDDMRPDQLLDVCFAHLFALYRAGEMRTLAKVAYDGWWPWPGTAVERMIARAFALSLLGRWRETADLLDDARRHDDGPLLERHILSIVRATGLWVGRSAEFERDLATLPARCRTGEAPQGELECAVSDLLTLGEFHRAERLLADVGRSAEQLTLPSRAVLAFYRGDLEDALGLTRESTVTDGVSGCDAVQTAMYCHAAELLLRRGRLTRAKELLTLARNRYPVLPHLLCSIEALHDLTHGELERARPLLRSTADRVEADGVVVEADTLWMRLADIDTGIGEPERLSEYLAKVERIARLLGTERAELSRLTLHAGVHRDQSAAAAARRLARQRGQPIEESMVLLRLFFYGLAEPSTLLDAHHLLGDADALLTRALVRNLMRELGVTVPGRQAIVRENERLLAVLVAEGLGNKQIAAVLRTSEKSVEGRMSRLFARSGHRSRVELATAMLSRRLDS